jgi:hypothetical protein
MEVFMSKIMGVFSSGEGEKISAMRVASLFTVFSIMGIFIAHNVLAMVHGLGIVSLDWNMVALITAVLGVKAYQQKNETSSAVEAETPEKPEETPKDLPQNEIP